MVGQQQHTVHGELNGNLTAQGENLKCGAWPNYDPRSHAVNRLLSNVFFYLIKFHVHVSRAEYILDCHDPILGSTFFPMDRTFSRRIVVFRLRLGLIF